MLRCRTSYMVRQRNGTDLGTTARAFSSDLYKSLLSSVAGRYLGRASANCGDTARQCKTWTDMCMDLSRLSCAAREKMIGQRLIMHSMVCRRSL